MTLDKQKVIEWWDKYPGWVKHAFMKSLESGVLDIPSTESVGEAIRLRESLERVRAMASGGGQNGYIFGKLAAFRFIIQECDNTLNTTVIEPHPIIQAIRDFMPTSEQRAGYEALIAWLESTTPFTGDGAERCQTCSGEGEIYAEHYGETSGGTCPDCAGSGTKDGRYER